MKISLKKIAIYILLIYPFAAQSQLINYATASLPTENCNLFNYATIWTIGGFNHYPISGGVNSTSSGLILKTKGSNSFSTTYATAYAIAYPIKQGYTYNITVSTYTSDFLNPPFLGIGVLSGLPNPNNTNPTACNSVPRNNWSILEPNLIGASGVNSTSYQNYPIVQNFTSDNNYNYFTVLAYGGSTVSEPNLLIRSINIVEAAPQPEFTISPASIAVTCGQTSNHAFTVNNVKNTPGVTGYEWNLGAEPNGWIYNGSAAPQFINTLTNTLNISSTPCASLSNISAKAIIGSNSYSTASAAVSINLPNLEITGSSSLCSGTEAYTINGLPCGAGVTWSAPVPSGIATLTTNGNNASLTATGNGNITLSAVVNACGNNYNPITKIVKIGSIKPTFNYNAICDNSQSFNLCANSVPSDSHRFEAITQNGTITLDDFGSWCVEVPPYTLFVDLYVTDNCGETKTRQRIFLQNCLTAQDYFLYPNPSSGNTTVVIDKSTVSKTKGDSDNSITNVDLYDKSMNIKRRYKFAKGTLKATIDVSNLETDVYYLYIFDSKKWSTQKLLITR